MKLRFFIVLVAALGLSRLPLAAQTTNQLPYTSPQEKASYAAGLFFGNQLKSGNLDLNLDLVMTAMKEVISGQEPKLNQQEAREAIMTYQQQRNKELAEKNNKLGDEFLAANKKKEGVHTKEIAMPDGKTAEFQYKVLSEGSGESPAATDMVKVKYRGTLLDGTEFDGTDKRGDQPSQFAVGQVIRGWSEALQMMKPGAKWQLFIPASLAYAENPRPGSGIPPGATLLFDVELVEIVKPNAESQQPPAQPKPLTSDIIRVPSAEEMKQGAKIEVIKASDLEKSNAVHNAKGSSTVP